MQINAPRRLARGTFCHLSFCGTAIVTQRPQGAIFTVRLPCHTQRPAMEHHAVAEVVGLLRGNDTAQLLLHLQGILAAVGDAQPPGDADAVGVADIAILAVNVAQDQVGGLAPHTGQ